MISDYTKIDPDDENAVVWLQLALSKLYPGPGHIVHIGKLGPMTEKTLRLYQHSRQLPMTGAADEATLQKIRQELKERDITV